jgi:predicted TIM-barrel fold metal-dependent hydrolase
MGINKREFLSGVSALSGSIPFQPYRALAAGTPTVRIDAHCHLFNGRDLPIFGLLLYTILQVNVFGIFAEPLALLLASYIENQAPSYDDEKDILDNHLIPNPAAIGEYKRNSEKAPEIFAEGLKRFVDRYTSFGERPTAIVIDRNDALLLELLRRFGSEPLSGLTKDDLIKKLQSKEFREDLIKRIIQYKKTKNDFGSIDELSQYYSQFFRWAATFLDYHFQLVQELAGLFGEDDSLRIMATAIVDFGPWPEPWWYRDILTTPYQQADLIQKISLIQPKGRVLTGYIGYDPWQHLKDIHHKVHPNAFEVVQLAIERMGFVGVKLYPPMGFMPLNNSSLDGDTSQFPTALVKLCNGRPGHEIDKVLTRLYAYCDQHRLAIQAHCANTIGSEPDYAKRADPILWLDVLKNYKGIRLNLGHFGGIWDFWSDPRCGSNTPTYWPKEIDGMLAGGKHPNLYTDVADFSGVLDRWDSEDCSTQDIFSNLAPLLQNNPYLRSRLMYGSDWMLLDFEPQNQYYYQKMRDAFSYYLNPTELDGFLGRTAATLLGLHTGDMTRKRVEDFYRQNGKAPPDFAAYGL